MEYFVPQKKLDLLLSLLRESGYSCIGPQVKNETIVFDELDNASQLPWGVQSLQQPGKYRLKPGNNEQAFAWANGPQAIKPILFKPQESLWRVVRDKNGKLTFKEETAEVKSIALIGARACDIAGMKVQDKTLSEDRYPDKRYKMRKENLFIVAVHCGFSADNCFCVSTNTGPKAESGFDLALTEINAGFSIESGSARGTVILDKLECEPIQADQKKQAQANIEHASKQQTKRMPEGNSLKLRDILMNNLEHPRWDEVADRCLSCGNCTSVCPTCFCHHETETASLDGSESQHERQWDSCFSNGHSHIHGKVIRGDTKSQYKQWLTHKLGTWWDQFNTSGCVGCGRCITWCPVGIDITEEMAALAKKDK